MINEYSEKMMKLAVSALEDKKAENTSAIDISEISSLGDIFIITNGSNHSQVQAMADNVQEVLAREGYHPKAVEGYSKANWVLLDYRDVIIHIFDKESRSYYDLDRIWRDADKIL